MSSTRIFVSIAALLLAGAMVLPLVNRKGAAVSAQNSPAPPVVQVVAAESRPMQRTVRLTGTLQSGSEATLSPKHGGKIVGVFVVEGQAVRQGQPLIHLDRSDAQRHAEQAQAAVQAARAQWEKALEGERLKRLEVERRIGDARRGVDQAKLQLEKAEAGVRMGSRAAQADVQRAQAAVDAARSALAQAKRGLRPQQRRQLQLQVAQAERGVALARRNRDDMQTLFNKGGIPRVQLDEAREGHQKAQDGLNQARAQLELAEAGAGREEIAAAEAQVRGAEAALAAATTAASREDVDDADLGAARGLVQQAEAGLQAALGSRGELEVAKRDVRAARAALAQAEAAARLAQQQVRTASLEAPVDGIVTEVHARAGEMAGPGQPLLKVVSTKGVYLEAAAPSRILPDLRPGQRATIRIDALPGKSFQGSLRAISQTAGPDGRSYPVKINVLAPSGALRAGGFARAEVAVEDHSGAVTVPLSALRTEGGRTVVWVVRQERIVEVPVETPVQSAGRVMVRGELRPGDQVIVSAGPGMRPGDAALTRVSTSK